MSAQKDGGRAFPLSRENEGWFEGGMSLRDYFATQALSGILAGPMAPHLATVAEERGVEPADIAAASAYDYADAMLKARNS